jgi:hypothetical protein
MPSQMQAEAKVTGCETLSNRQLHLSFNKAAWQFSVAFAAWTDGAIMRRQILLSAFTAIDFLRGNP